MTPYTSPREARRFAIAATFVLALVGSIVSAQDPLGRAKDFYAKKVGLRLKGGSPKMGWMEFGAAKGTTIQLFESDSKKSEDTAATFTVRNLVREMKELRERGVKFEDYDLPGIKTVDGIATMGKTKAAWFKDPGGNVIAIVQER